MKTVVIIPARYASSRFPGKPLHIIAGKSMIQRVYQNAVAAKGIDGVYVATDDQRIIDHVESFGGKAIMTPENCRNGTERCFAALEYFKEKPDVIINQQGDSPISPPHLIEKLAEAMTKDGGIQIATPAVRLTEQLYQKLLSEAVSGQAGGTTVTFDKNMNALYFSKMPIPFLREKISPLPVFKHIGIYAYRRDILEKLVTLHPTPLETVEGLEQLRALENAIPIKVVEASYNGRTPWSVDNPSDAKMVEDIIAKEGEITA